jgi:hypothetical protein
MAKQSPVARKHSRSKRDEHDEQQEAEPGTGQSGREEDVARYEQELVGYLQERIKPGLNRGSIPLLVRSIAKEIAHRDHVAGASEDAGADDDHAEAEDEFPAEEDEDYDADEDDEPSDEDDEDYDADEDDEPSDEEDEDYDAEEDGDDSAQVDDEPRADDKAPPDFEADMRELQAELGEDWILRFSVHGDDAWLTAEKQDGSQHLEAPTAEALLDAVDLLDQDDGRSS